MNWVFSLEFNLVTHKTIQEIQQKTKTKQKNHVSPRKFIIFLKEGNDRMSLRHVSFGLTVMQFELFGSINNCITTVYFTSWAFYHGNGIEKWNQNDVTGIEGGGAGRPNQSSHLTQQRPTSFVYFLIPFSAYGIIVASRVFYCSHKDFSLARNRITDWPIYATFFLIFSLSEVFRAFRSSLPLRLKASCQFCTLRKGANICISDVACFAIDQLICHWKLWKRID